MRTARHRTLASIVLLVIFLAPRLPALKAFVTTDEPFWLAVGGNFYYALGQREFENTVYEYHPAVTTMWLVTLGFLSHFPEFRGLGQGYFDVDKEDFDPFLNEHGKSPLELLYLARLFQLIVLTLAVLVLFLLLAELLGRAEAFLTASFALSAPLLVGYSRVLDHEAMVAIFVLISLTALAVYLERGGRLIMLVISGAAAALANLTKSSAMAMLPVVVIMLLVAALRQSRELGWAPALLGGLKAFGVWALSLAVAYVIVWPGMWVAPGKMLYEVFGNAFSYALQGGRLQVTGQLQPGSFELDAPWATLRMYLREVWWRSTPATWLGWLLAATILVSRRRKLVPAEHWRFAGLLALAAVLFIALFSIAQGRNSSHYILTSHAALGLVAALGWLAAARWLLEVVLPGKDRPARIWLVPGLALALTGLQLGSAAPFRPYFYTYSTPIAAWLRAGVPASDYGEGFEGAAAYIAAKPDAENIAVLSFRGRGPFSYFFPGRTIILNPLFMEEPRMGSLLGRLEQADYLVFNAALPRRTPRTARLTAALQGVAPELTLQIPGAYEIYVYRVDTLPDAFYAALTE